MDDDTVTCACGTRFHSWGDDAGLCVKCRDAASKAKRHAETIAPLEAKLRAAAPRLAEENERLREALKRISGQMHGHDKPVTNCDACIARAALAGRE